LALDERRLAMLRAMGVPFWRPLAQPAPAVMAVAPSPPAPPPPGGRGEGSAGPTPLSLPAESAVHPPGPAVRSANTLPGPSTPTVERSEDQPPGPSTAAVDGSEDRPPGTTALAGEGLGRGGVPHSISTPPQPEAGGRDANPASDEVASMDWATLRATVAGCRACALCDSRRQTVFGAGHPRAHWMIVGEAPGEQEDLRGEPFVGPAGQLLDNMLRALGLTRAETAAEGQPALEPARQVYIANTLKCRPPRNRNPEPEEMRRCEPYLQRQIALVQPRLILAMGRFAVQSLLRTDEAIGRLRGRVHRYQGVPLVVTYHPAYLLRNLPDKARAWEDLCLAAQTVESLPPR
jgi:uracil-DNA glycosylase family 4